MDAESEGLLRDRWLGLAPPKEGPTHTLTDDYYTKPICPFQGAMAAGIASRYKQNRAAARNVPLTVNLLTAVLTHLLTYLLTYR